MSKSRNIDHSFTKQLTTKAEVLEFLSKHLKKSNIEKLYYFDIKEWKNNKSNILEYISKNFASTIVLRSSSKGEDSFESSEAGTYESVLNVDSQSKKDVAEAIQVVISSYTKKGNNDPYNKVLIQNQTKNISYSGVIFTRTPNTGAPYYVINYDEGRSTESVTKGIVNNTVKIFRNCSIRLLPEKLQFLIQAVKEIEKILHSVSLDIEFGITISNHIIIFQARPITSIKKFHMNNLDIKIVKLIEQCRKKFSKLVKSNQFGTSTIFSDMADWNPAEIIGNNPNLLDYSLYDYLIMTDAWTKGRTKIGYQNIGRTSLMVKFGNKPYVNVRLSFNSLTPEIIDNDIKKKLMLYYINKLKLNPSLHDKVEFEILFSCYDIALESRLQELYDYGFNTQEINEIKIKLKEFTNQVLKNFPSISRECSKSINSMINNRRKILTKLKNSNYLDLLNAAEKLLHDCRNLGTIPFSTMARIAFIASIILKSLLKKEYIDSNFYDNFMNSINTQISEFRNDFVKYSNKKLSKKKFLTKYGHLRAGTYDITARRYDQENELFEKIKFLKTIQIKNPPKNYLIDEILSKKGLLLDSIDFLSFTRDSLRQREELKFVFSRNLSDAIELIAKAGKELGFSRSDMSHLDINTILLYKKQTKNKLKKLWKNKIQSQKRKFTINNYLVLPPIISSANDFEIYEYHLAKPNFITAKNSIAPLVYLKNSNWVSLDLENKIVLIENADPGYDWLFTKKLAGLITKYGGVASHMSIRCAELGLPAAIGCGEILYGNLINSSKVLLDCKNEQIIILEHEETDETLEARKTLKTLGYIK